jgi:serine/threonine protein phosphatase PrpC
VIPDVFEIAIPSTPPAKSPPSDADATGIKRKRRNATTRYGNRPPIYTAEPRSVWGVLASRIRQLSTSSVEQSSTDLYGSVIEEIRELMEQFDSSTGSEDQPTGIQQPLLRLKKISQFDWKNIPLLVEDPLEFFFKGTLSSLFHKTPGLSIGWVYSIHPIDLLAALNNNHLVEDADGKFRRCVSDDQGCTANVCLISVNESPCPLLYCANAGDSRSIVVRSDGRAVPLSIDHKPSLAGERRRILHAGGRIIGKMDPRVQGDLNLSRAIGDWRHKQNRDLPLELQMISPRPDITITEISKDDEFIVLGCDGIWERFSSLDCASFVATTAAQPRNDEVGSPPSSRGSQLSPQKQLYYEHHYGVHIDKKLSVGEICEKICAATVRKPTEFSGVPVGASIGCDNMSVIVVRIGDKLRESIEDDQEQGDSDKTTVAPQKGTTLPIITFGAQVPDDWKPAASESSRLRKQRASYPSDDPSSSSKRKKLNHEI